MCDVEAAPALIARRLEQVLGVDAELLDVEQPVLVRQPLSRRLALVQRGAQRRPDPGADQPDQMLTLYHRSELTGTLVSQDGDRQTPT
jgi:hypothetical protein